MQRKQGKKLFGIIRLFFIILCVFSFLRVYTSYYVSTSSFSDTEHITATFLMGSAVCTHGQGFWRHHPDRWPVENLTIGGIFYTKTEAIAIMNTPGARDKTYDLFRHLAATMLNLFCGCDPDCIQETVGLADNWFISHPVGSDVHANSPAWKLAKPWCKLLEKYNKGLLCEESCNSPPDLPCALSPDSPFNATTPQLAVYVSDDDYDELTVSFYNAQNDSVLGECSAVESDSNVSIQLDGLPDNESFSWYVIVTDQQAATMSPTWWFTIDTNDTETMDGDDETSDNTSSPPGAFDYVDLSPPTAVANTPYIFQVLAQNNSFVPEIMVVYWYNETTQTSLMLCNHEGIWNASIIIASNVTRFCYRLYIAYETGLWNPVEEHEVSITDGGEGE
jgi:hypothetical protein